MSQIRPEQVRRLLVSAEEADAAATAARTARDALDHVLLDVARSAKVGVSDLAAVTGMHPNSVRAGIRRAVGESGMEHDQLAFDFEELIEQRSASFPQVAVPRGPVGAPDAEVRRGAAGPEVGRGR